MKNKFQSKIVTGASELQMRRIESVRFKDEDESIKCGALLGYSALLLGALTVQLSVNSDSILYVDDRLNLSALSYLTLFIGAAGATANLVNWLSYETEVELLGDQIDQATDRYDTFVMHKGRYTKIIGAFVFLGTIFTSFSIFGALYG